MKTFLRNSYRNLRKISPTLFYLIQYKRASSQMGNTARKQKRLFDEFLETCRGGRCLQIGVKDSVGAKYGPNWISVDKYDDRPFIDYHYDVHDLEFEDDSFDGIACVSVLEHVPYPQLAIKELHRVLKPGGRIWVQLPFQYPYHEGPQDYWRVSPGGLRIWMEGFKEISCGNFLWTRSSLVTSTYFYGFK